MNDAISQFKAAIHNSGLEPPDVIEAGKLHRFPTNGKRGDDAGWCKLFPDMRGGVFGDHRSGLSEHWQAKTDRVMTASEREAFQRMVAESKHQAELEERKRHEAAALKAAAILDAATGAPATHPYAVKKRVPLGSKVKRGPWPQRGWNDALLVPIYGVDGRVQSIEAINSEPDADGKFPKDSLKHGKKIGGFYPLGKVRGASRMFIAESVANAAVGAEVDKSPAAASMGKSNLKAVALVVRELAAPDADIIFLADNDVKPDGSNPGLKAANEAAAAVGGRVAIPNVDGRKCDFWDLWHERGAEAAAATIADAKAGTRFRLNGGNEDRQPDDEIPPHEANAQVTEKTNGTGVPGMEDGQETPHQPLADVLAQLRALHNEDIKDGDWQRIIYEAGLAARDVDVTLTFLVEECKLGKKRPLLQDWNRYRDREDHQQRCERAERTLSAEAGGRVLIECDTTSIDNLTVCVERAMLGRPGRWELLVCGGIYMRVAKGRPIHAHAIDEPDVPAPECVILKPYTLASILRRIEQSVALFHPATETKPRTAAEVPHRLVVSLLDAAQPYAPETIGLVTHPIVSADGRLLSKSGLDARTGLYLHVAEEWDVRANTQEEATAHLKYLKKALFGEFAFCTPLDADVAVSMLFTGVERKVMDQAPGYVAHANQQSSGKTALARFVHVTITGYDMAASTLSSDQGEAKKEILAQLLESPMMVCFDNIADGEHVCHPVLAKVLTAPFHTDRLLGFSRNATTSTATLFVLTGNNITLDPDLASRLVYCDLKPQIKERRFQHPHVVPYVRSIRCEVLRAVLGIVLGYLNAGAPDMGLAPCRFYDWNRLVRAPIRWAGGLDVADKFETAKQRSPELQGGLALLLALHNRYGHEEFRAVDVQKAIELAATTDPLRAAVLRVNDKAAQSAKSLGHTLSKLADRIFPHRKDHITLKYRVIDGNSYYRVETNFLAEADREVVAI